MNQRLQSYHDIDDWQLERSESLKYITEIEESFYPVLLIAARYERPEGENTEVIHFLQGALTKASLPVSIYNLILVVVNRLVRESTLVKPKAEPIDKYLRTYTNECTQRAIQLYHGVLDVLYVHVARLPSETSRKHFLLRYFLYALMDILEDKYKFHSGYLYCSLLPETEKPIDKFPFEGEIPGIVLGGWVRRFFSSKGVKRSLKLTLANSLQNAKRAAAAISKRKQAMAVIDHQKAMLGKGYSRTDEQEQHITGVMDKLDKLTKIYFDRGVENEIPIWRLPSQGACYERKKKETGTMGLFYDKFINPTGILPSTNETKCYHFADLSVEETDWMNTNTIPQTPIFSFGFDIGEIKGHLWKDVWEKDRCHADFHQVLEPFKLRGITASNGYIYHLGRLLQPVLHRSLRSEDGPFRFIGKSNNVDDINNVYAGVHFYTEIDRERCELNLLRYKPKINSDHDSLFYDESYVEPRNIRPKVVFRSVERRRRRFTEYGISFRSKTFFVAGDFKSATDNMDPRLPAQFIKSLTKYARLSEGWVKVLNLTLGSHTIHYPPLDSRFKDIEHLYLTEVEQCWGQLMGSPTSFPVLNLVNAAMLWHSVEVFTQSKISWKRVLYEWRPLFNGDDISFLSNSSHYMIWKDVCTGCGLALSPGKNYCTDEFVNINSTNYKAHFIEIDNMKVVSHLTEEFVLNPGLIKGQAKVLEDTRIGEVPTGSLSPICDQLEQCIRVATPIEKERALEVFRKHLEPRLMKSHRSWCLPRHLGGLGLPFGTANDSQLEIALGQIYKGYKDLSDEKVSHVFQDMSNEYWRQLAKVLPPEVGIQLPHVSTPDSRQGPNDLFELPDLAQCFMSNEELYKDENLMHLLKINQSKGKKITPEPGMRKLKSKTIPWEDKFLKEKRKYRPNNPKNILNRLQMDRQDLIKLLCETTLCKGGSKKKINVDVCKSSMEEVATLAFLSLIPIEIPL